MIIAPARGVGAIKLGALAHRSKNNALSTKLLVDSQAHWGILLFPYHTTLTAYVTSPNTSR